LFLLKILHLSKSDLGGCTCFGQYCMWQVSYYATTYSCATNI